MTRAGAALVLLLALALPAGAAETGVIEGVVVNETSGEPQRGVEVTLVGARADGGGRIEKTLTTGAGGRYRFDDLPTGEDRFYALDARYKGGLFSGSAVSLPSTTDETPVIESRLKVWDTTSDPEVVLIARDDVFLTQAEGGLDVIESVTVANMTELAYVGRGAGGTDERDVPTLGIALPSGGRAGGIEVLDSTLEVPGLLETDFGIALTHAIPPGQHRVTFRYRVPGAAGIYDLSRTALYPVVQTSVHAAGGIDIASNRLIEAGDVTVGGIEYRRWSANGAIEAGDQVQISATATAGGRPRLVAAIVAGGLAALALIGVAVVRVRRRRTPPVIPASSRADLLAAIARLDIAHERGDIDDEEWTRRRAELKTQAREREPEHAG